MELHLRPTRTRSWALNKPKMHLRGTLCPGPRCLRDLTLLPDP